MKTRFPLYAKILGWFFLNLLVLGVIGWILLSRHVDSNWMLTEEAKTRIKAMTTVLKAELDSVAPDEWNEILTRFSSAYQMKLALWENRGVQVAGEKMELPAQVKTSLAEHPPRLENHPPPRRDEPEPPPDFELLPGDLPFDRPSFDGPEPREPEASDEMRIQMMDTDTPARHWLLVRAHFKPRTPGVREPISLIGMTTSLSQSGLLFNPWPLITTASAMLVFSILFWIPLVRDLTRTISRMTKATENIAEGNFDVQLHDQRRDELGRLAFAINSMAQRLDGFVTGQRRFLGDIAHELCSPLARMELAMGVIEQRAPPGVENYLADVQEEVREMRDLVNDLLSFSKAVLRDPNAPLNLLKLDEIVLQVINRESLDAEKLQVDVPGHLHVLGDNKLLCRAIANVLRNAVRYAGAGGPISITANVQGERIELKISDRGPGVPASVLPQIFDAFYRPDSARERDTGGAGLGLAIVKTCVTACRGTVSARSREGGGLEILISLSRTD